MKREPSAYLLDIRQAAENIEVFLIGFDLAEFEANVLTRSAVERQLQNIGEALSQLSRIDAVRAQAIPKHRELIGLRNVLVHGYSGLNVEELWQSIRQHLPELLSAARAASPPPPTDTAA